MGFMDKIKDLAGKNPDKVDQATSKIGDEFNKRTDGKYEQHTETAKEKAGEFLKGDQPGGDQPGGGQPGGGQPQG